MKKSLLALAVLGAFAGASQAQTSVTMFGIVDAAVARVSGSGVGSTTGISTSGINSSRFGVRGVEDLGGGLKASFHLEAALSNDDGSGGATSSTNQPLPATAPAVRPGTQGLTFNRRSTLSLMGGFGEIRIGRDYVPTFWNLTFNDPFGTNGVAGWNSVGLAGLSTTAVRASNSIGYFLPNLGGIYGQVMFAAGENNSQLANKKDGNYAGFRFGYAAGPIDVALAYGKTNYATGDIKATNIGGSYNLGMVKPMLVWQEVKTGTQKRNMWLLGATAPLGGGELRVSYSDLDVKNSGNDASQFGVGYVFNLSRRTAIYGTFSQLDNEGAGRLALSAQGGLAAPAPLAGGKSTGYEVGFRHSF
jgi:predicted porin